MKRTTQKKVLNELSKQMLLGKVQPKSKVMLDVFDGQCLSRFFGMVFRAPRVEEAIVLSEN